MSAQMCDCASIYSLSNCTDSPQRALAGWSLMCWMLSACGWLSRLPQWLCTLMCLGRYNRAVVFPPHCMSSCVLSTCKHVIPGQTHTSLHIQKIALWEPCGQLFPASWLAPALYCPTMKRDHVSLSCRWSLSGHVAENKEMFSSISPALCSVPTLQGDRVWRAGRLFFQFRTMRCDWGTAECAGWERRVSVEGRSTLSKPLMFEGVP